MKIISFLLLIVLYSLQATAQGENNIWYFGFNAGVDFNSGSPVALTNGSLSCAEGCATICDKNGNLLFYTDGQRVWTRTHVQMPNGFGLLGNNSSTQSAVIVPKPGSTTRFYIFTVAVAGGLGGFCYSEVDMTLNGGLGDIMPATKNTSLFTSTTEKVMAIRHRNGQYVWVIGQELSGNFRSYLIDCSGINTTAVMSNVGHAAMANGLGYLVGSPDGQKIANAIWALGNFVYDFDNATGLLSNRISLGTTSTPSYAYGICFSPDNKLLYGISIFDGRLFQWNLMAGSSAAIIASATLVGTIPLSPAAPSQGYRGGAIVMGPDKKLYLPQYYSTYLAAVNVPNTLGTGCNFQLNAVSLAGRTEVLGLPTFFQNYSDTIIHTQHCYGLPTSFSLRGGSYADSLHWKFGDPLSGNADTSGNRTPDHVFSAIGTYQVRVVKFFPCITDTTYATVVIDSTPVVHLGNDTTLCSGTLTLQSANGYASPSYLWSTGATTLSITVSTSDAYWLQVTKGTCVGSDTIVVNINPNLNVDLGSDRAICNTDLPLRIGTQQPAGTQYTWSTGLTSDSVDVVNAGTYWVHAVLGDCEGGDTIKLSVVQVPVVDAGRDTIICEATPIQIGVFIPDAVYQWSNESTTPFINVNTTGDYVLTVTLGPCIVKDTVAITAMPDPVINLGVDTDICPKQVFALNAGNPGSTYEWGTGETTMTYNADKAGKYWVTVTSQYSCVSSDTILFKYYAAPTVILGDDTTVCEETPLILQPVYVINEDSLIWSTGAVGNQIEIVKGDAYMVTAINKCGNDTDVINVRQIFCDIWLPNAFTPNGDGINDILRVVGNIGRITDFSLSVYNRWGELVFTTNDKTAGWNGAHKGVPAAIDTYVYMYQYSFEGEPVMEKGNVILIR